RHGRLRNANRQFPKTVFVEQFDAALRGAVKVHTVGPVKLRGQRFDLLFNRRFQRIHEANGFAFALLDAAQHGFSQTGRAGAALVKMSGHDGFNIVPGAELDDSRVVLRVVIREMAEAYHGIEAEPADVLDVLGEVAEAAGAGEAAVVGNGLDRGDDDGG